MKKVLVLVLLLATLVSALAIPSYAALPQPPDGVQWTNTQLISATVGFVDGVGYAEALVTGKFGTTHITVNVDVFIYIGNSWIRIAQKEESVDDMVCGISCPFTAYNDDYYMADYTFTITRGGTDETIYRTEYKHCVL